MDASHFNDEFEHYNMFHDYDDTRYFICSQDRVYIVDFNNCNTFFISFDEESDQYLIVVKMYPNDECVVLATYYNLESAQEEMSRISQWIEDPTTIGPVFYFWCDNVLARNDDLDIPNTFEGTDD